MIYNQREFFMTSGAAAHSFAVTAFNKTKMNCPNCSSNNIRENGHRRGKQNYQCKDCGRQFIDVYSHKGYPKEFKEECLTMYVNGNGFRAIERIKKVNHNTVIRWVREIGNRLPDSPESYQTPQVAQLDELQTFVGKKK